MLPYGIGCVSGGWKRTPLCFIYPSTNLHPLICVSLVFQDKRETRVASGAAALLSWRLLNVCVCVCVYFVRMSHDNRSCVQARVAQCRALTDVIAKGSLTNISIALVGHRPISRPPTAVHRCHVDIVFCYVQEEINSIDRKSTRLNSSHL